MPTWEEVSNEIRALGNPLDSVRRKYLKLMSEYTGRNTIAYYSGFLQKPQGNTTINDSDKMAFMGVVHGLDRKKGLDLILHTPGGNIAATESLVDYLKSLFGNDIRAFIPQIAMSAGTMIALSCKEIIMGKESNIGPIDPQVNGISCAGVVEEFRHAKEDIKKDPSSALLWQTIISKYHPTFLGDCQQAIIWSKDMVTKWLKSNMFSSEDENEKVKKIVDYLSSHKATFNHAKHISFNEAKDLGIRVLPLEGLCDKKKENCRDLQDCVLTIHHCYMQTFSVSSAVKITENQLGHAMITNDIPTASRPRPIK